MEGKKKPAGIPQSNVQYPTAPPARANTPPAASQVSGPSGGPRAHTPVEVRRPDHGGVGRYAYALGYPKEEHDHADLKITSSMNLNSELIKAAKKGNADRIELLVKHGADVNFRPHKGIDEGCAPFIACTIAMCNAEGEGQKVFLQSLKN